MNNFTNNRWVPVLTLLLLTANIVTLILLWTNKKQAGGVENKMPPPPGQVFEFINRELKLDPAQREAYTKLRDEHQADVRPLQDSIRKSKDKFFELLQSENVSDTLVQEYSKKTGELEQRRDVFTFRHFQKLRAICNKEQQSRFDSIIQEALRRMGGPKRLPGPPPGMENGEEGPPD
ncbi:MAG: Spy/CpxP family protein refolding chaperone [Ferruginibacter sp.]